MNGDRTMDALYFALLLILPISALVARRVPMSKVLFYALAWVGIAAAAFAIVELFGLDKPKPHRVPPADTVFNDGGVGPARSARKTGLYFT